MEYKEIKKNIIERFLNRNYRYVVLTNKSILSIDMEQRLPFSCVFENNFNNLIINLGDNVKVELNVHWESRNNKTFRLIKFD